MYDIMLHRWGWYLSTFIKANWIFPEEVFIKIIETCISTLNVCQYVFPVHWKQFRFVFVPPPNCILYHRASEIVAHMLISHTSWSCGVLQNWWKYILRVYTPKWIFCIIYHIVNRWRTEILTHPHHLYKQTP